MVMIRFAETDEDIQRCFAVMQELRPHLGADAFVGRVRRQQQQGYRLVFLEDAPDVRSVAGFRLHENLAWGRILYIDDLATAERERRQGSASRLLDWLIAHAREHLCDQVHLDSGYQRNDAHRLYLNKGFVLSSHHFLLAL